MEASCSIESTGLDSLYLFCDVQCVPRSERYKRSILGDAVCVTCRSFFWGEFYSSDAASGISDSRSRDVNQWDALQERGHIRDRVVVFAASPSEEQKHQVHDRNQVSLGKNV